MSLITFKSFIYIALICAAFNISTTNASCNIVPYCLSGVSGVNAGGEYICNDPNEIVTMLSSSACYTNLYNWVEDISGIAGHMLVQLGSAQLNNTVVTYSTPYILRTRNEIIALTSMMITDYSNIARSYTDNKTSESITLYYNFVQGANTFIGNTSSRFTNIETYINGSIESQQTFNHDVQKDLKNNHDDTIRNFWLLIGSYAFNTLNSIALIITCIMAYLQHRNFIDINRADVAELRIMSNRVKDNAVTTQGALQSVNNMPTHMLYSNAPSVMTASKPFISSDQ